MGIINDKEIKSLQYSIVNTCVPVKLLSDVREVNLYIKENRQITHLLYHLFQTHT